MTHLDHQDIRTIKLRHMVGETLPTLATRYNLTLANVESIVYGEVFAVISPEYTCERPALKPVATPQPKKPRAKSDIPKQPRKQRQPRGYTLEDVAAIKARRFAGESVSALAGEYGLGIATVSNMCRGKNFKLVAPQYTVKEYHLVSKR